MKYILENENENEKTRNHKEKFTKLQSIKSTIKSNLTLYWSLL